MTTNDSNSDGGPLPATLPTSGEARSIRGFSLASLMLAVTLVSVMLGLYVVAPGLGIAATIILLPAAARTAIVLRHTAPAAALSAKLAAFGTSCCVAIVVGVAACVCGFASCWVVGVPSAFVTAAVYSQFSQASDYAPLFIGGVSAGALTGCAVGVVFAYHMMLQRPWVPVPVESISKPERRYLLGILMVTAIGASAGAILTLIYLS